MGITRRALLGRTAGLALTAGFLGRPSAAQTASSEVERVALRFMELRARAMDQLRASDVRAVGDLIADTNRPLRGWVEQDLVELNRVIHSHHSLIEIKHDYWIESRQGNVVDVYERIAHPWRNEGTVSVPDHVVPAEQLTTRPVIDSSMGIRHRIQLEPFGGTYGVRLDAYRGVGWDSPDVGRLALVPASPAEANVLAATRRAPKGARPLLAAYLWDHAVNYCYTYWSNYNPNYYNYNGLGGDCTSFISQALANAGWTAGNTSDPNAYWYIAEMAPWVGKAWYNNNQQKPWILNNGRGWQVSGGTPQDLLRGDVVYYDWNTADGTLDHTVMVTTIPSSTYRRLISGHNPDCNEQDWETYWASWLRPFVSHNLRLYSNY